jgi:hypothetical protein
MQTVKISAELDIAMNSIEKLLNNKNGDEVIDAIRKFKASKTTSSYSYNRLGK